MAEQVEICVIDDDPSQRRLVARMLEKHGYTVGQASDGEEGLVLIRQTQPKVILSDWMMPRLDGMGLCEAVRSDPSIGDTYFILLTSRDTVDDKASALETGADDFLTKPCEVREMVARVRVGIRMWTLQQKLRQAAITDGLTGLYNYHHFSRLLTAEYERARRYVQPLTLIIADLDHFKSVNDTYGHETGNVVLRCVAEALKKGVRSVDTLARYGGEEFAVVLPETSLQHAMELAKRLRLVLPAALPPGTLGDRKLTASFGVASIEDPQVTSVQQLINLADQALYVAKRNGRNRVVTCAEVSADGEPETPPEREIDVLRDHVTRLKTQNEDLKRQIVHALVQALDTKDAFAARHAQSVKTYADAIAHRLNVEPEAARIVSRAALLHEVGRIGIDKEASAPETSDDFEAVCSKTQSILDPLQCLAEELHVIRHLSESFDGFGKPEGLRAEDIPLGSRILRVADAFDVLTMDRSHGAACSQDEAARQLRAQCGRLYDSMVVSALSECVESEREAWQLWIEQKAAEHLPVSETTA